VAAVIAGVGGPDAAAPPGPVPVPGSPEVLSCREVEVLALLVDGASNRAIAGRLFISEHTVKTHVHRILDKLGVGSRTQAAARARDLHLV
jgi:LuxR family maltose regulon positive regulatory protein